MQQQYLCLTDLLDQDLSGQEFFNSLPNRVRKKLLESDDIRTFNQLQQQAAEFREQEEEYQ